MPELVAWVTEHLAETYAAGGLCVGALVTWLWQRRRAAQAAAQAFEDGLVQNANAHQADVETFELRIEQLRETEVAQTTTVHSLTEQLEHTMAELQTARQNASALQAEHAASKARLEEAQLGFKQREELFRETSAELKKEFEVLANKVFEQQEEKHNSRLNNVLNPFKEQIVDFKKRVEEVYHSDTKERASLLTEIKNLQSASERINEEAENLAKALKGDKKLQGNWGELVLERVLEESGLRRDHEYFVQATKRTEKGDIKRPDVLIRLPEDKDVVVDSKVSLNAYEEALASDDEELRDKLVKQHLTNMRGHVKRLSEQDYDQLPDVRSLDFVLMFVPIESAFTLAMECDHRLFTEAFSQRIVIVSPTTLMMTLRIINNVWRYEKQNRNAQEIARRAGALYDKLRLLVEGMDSLGKQLQTVDKTYTSVYSKLATGKGNLVRQVEHFRELGAQVKKPIDNKLLEQAGAETELGEEDSDLVLQDDAPTAEN